MNHEQNSTPKSDDTFIEKSVPKSYSLPSSLHKKLTAEAQRRSLLEGRRVSASQVLLEILRNSTVNNS